MSKGFGYLQNTIICLLWDGYEAGKGPMTFAEILATLRVEWELKPTQEFKPTFIRSLRRALQKAKGDVIRFNTGGPSDPYRYTCAIAVMDEARRRWPQLIDDPDTRTGLLIAITGGVKAGSGSELICQGARGPLG
jgi:hypothetical protein